MINKETMRIMNDLQDCAATIDTNRAAETLGISPKGFKRYLEGLPIERAAVDSLK